MTVSRIPLKMASVAAARSSFGRSKPGDLLQLKPFLNLARELAVLLAPVRPREAFSAELELGLLAAARQQNAQTSLHAFGQIDDGPMRRYDGAGNRVVIGAAAVGSAVSIVGLVAYMLHRRGERAA